MWNLTLSLSYFVNITKYEKKITYNIYETIILPTGTTAPLSPRSQ